MGNAGLPVAFANRGGVHPLGYGDWRDAPPDDEEMGTTFGWGAVVEDDPLGDIALPQGIGRICRLRWRVSGCRRTPHSIRLVGCRPFGGQAQSAKSGQAELM